MNAPRLTATIGVPGVLHDVSLDVGAGVTAVVGPNGAGKTTLVRAIAGLVPATGTVRVNGREWSGVPAFRRAVGLLSQGSDLFPHLRVLDNVAFGPRSRGAGRAHARRTSTEWLERLGIAHLAQRYPNTLSGGETQRVAIARALAIAPDVLVLDEPFASLDVGVAERLRHDLEPYLRERITLLVTHDPIDLFTLADRVVSLEAGVCVESGAVEEIAADPVSTHAARLTGANVLRGYSDGTKVRLASGEVITTSTAHTGAVVVTFPATAVTLSPDEPHGSARNVWPTTVRGLTTRGHTTRVHLDPPTITADLTTGAATELRVALGTTVFAAVKATEIRVVGAT